MYTDTDTDTDMDAEDMDEDIGKFLICTLRSKNNANEIMI